jgi:3-oxoadipate enol-lactonase
MAADAEALLDALGLERAVVAGWSMGGFVAQRLALRAPGRVAGLALVSSDPGGPEAVRADPAVWARLTDRSGTPRERASRLLALMFQPALAPEVDRRFGDLVAAGQAALPVATPAAQEAAMAAWHAVEQPGPAAGAPRALAVCGTADVVIPPANAERLAARWPSCRVERVAGAGHAVMAEAPDRVARLVGSLGG